MDRKIEELKNDYLNVPIPSELDVIVKKALKEQGVKGMRYKNRFFRIKVTAASVAAAFLVFTVGLNTSSVFAETASEVPVLGGLVKVLTFREYSINEGKYNMDIKVPEIQGLENRKLQSGLNERYLEENKKLYEKFMADMEALKENGGGNLGIKSGYQIMTDTDSILSIGRYVVNTAGSSSTVFKYDTVDKKKGVLITLPSLFKDERYVDVISDNVKKQMVEQYKADSRKFYWVAGIEQKGNVKLFEKISKDQNFYISPEGKLVISFDKYEVGPGSTGISQFVIPTDILEDILVSNEYIK